MHKRNTVGIYLKMAFMYEMNMFLAKLFETINRCTGIWFI
jgi:hypothetical protein